ncbi:hypothetical protein [Coraliomargarita akajimensis]|uniref:Uncharacterized protein n=1 Tax=Coraliomargarita akajimensis (strain DSM 45221 / IAM 15411 / JCM 23193 / KCTC 12865 / 04OKA010-24) TaxID=583355 RepID=D5EM25_CORAD|nr:hypothetical protein [Coraliomargarita akajimensis]ADE55185.1 hypothetical protein Caka_2167 [Coraliomargarita akajimensis DSM 45221]
MKTRLLYLVLGSLLVGTASTALATVDSGSDGSDGELNIPEDAGFVTFDPDDVELWGRILDADRDGIYHFTNITIGRGSTLYLSGDVLGRKPVMWLSSGNVDVAGSLTLNSELYRGGAGGFPGGSLAADGKGQGPGGGARSESQNVGDYPSADHMNNYLIPLIGGSGQGAGTRYNGSGGGGALLIACSGTVSINGYIDGHGAEIDGSLSTGSGNLRIVANRIDGGGEIYNCNILRFEAYHHQFAGSFGSCPNQVITRPGKIFYDNPIKITVVDGASVDHTKPGANKGAPDVTIDNGNAVTIKVECTGIALGTTIRVVGWNDTFGEVEATTGPLTGTLEASEATCQMVLPTGNTTFMAQAVLAP